MTEVVKISSRDDLGTGSDRDEDTPDRSTRHLMDAVLLAAERVGEDGHGKDGLVGYCRFLARCEPQAFARLRGRILPTQITGIGDPVEVLANEAKDAAIAAALPVDT